MAGPCQVRAVWGRCRVTLGLRTEKSQKSNPRLEASKANTTLPNRCTKPILRLRDECYNTIKSYVQYSTLERAHAGARFEVPEDSFVKY